MKLGHPRHAWLDIVDTYILENETESDCDDGDGLPQVVPSVHDTESDDESISMQSNFACGCMHVIVFFFDVYISCHDSRRVADGISSELHTVTHMRAVTDKLAATRLSVRSRKYKMETNNMYFT